MSAVEMVLVIVFPLCPALILQTRSNVALEPLLMFPIVQVPVAYVVLVEGEELTKVVPSGHASATISVEACAAPALLMVTAVSYTHLTLPTKRIV